MNLFKPFATGMLLTSSALVAMPAVAAPADIDVMVLYTDEALQEIADPDARITLMVEWMNGAISQSNIDAQVNLVHSQKINFANDGKTDEAALNALTSNAEVAALRQQHGADMVALITNTGPYCGIAWVPGNRAQGKLLGKDYSFSVTGAQCVSAFAHELGHNMGLGHSAAQGSTGSLFDWARGHGINNTFVTTMAYGSAYNTNVTVQRYSNPALNNCQGLPCGVDRNQNNGADAARNLNQVVTEVESYLESNSDGGGNDGGGNDGGDNEAPTTPGNLRAKLIKENSLKLYWVPSTDNVEVDHYEIFRGNVSVGTSNRKNYVDGGLTAGTTYQYYVVAKDAAGNTSQASNTLSVSTLGGEPTPDTQPPSTPENLRVTDTTPTSISLSWNAATDNVGVTGYKVIRDGAEIASTGATSYTDSDNNLIEGATYYYEVKATDAAANISNASNRVPAMLEEGGGNTPPGAGSDPANLLQNGHFDSLEGWQAVDGSLSPTSMSTAGNQGLLVNQRTSRTAGVRQFIAKDQLVKGMEYEFQADIRLSSSRSSLAAVLAIPTTGGLQLQTLASTTAKSDRWKTVSSTFTLAHDAIDDGYIYFYGPKSRYDMLLDEVLLKKAAGQAPVSAELTNLTNNPGFEQSVDGWEAYSSGTLIRDTDAYSGKGTAKLSGRDNAYSGLGQSLVSLIKAGETYQFSATMKHSGSNEAQKLEMSLYYKAEGQSQGQWIPLVSKAEIQSDTWTELSTSFKLPDGPIAEAYLLASGPAESVDLYVDQVTVQLTD